MDSTQKARPKLAGRGTISSSRQPTHSFHKKWECCPIFPVLVSAENLCEQQKPSEVISMETSRNNCHYPLRNSCVAFCSICFQRASCAFATSDFLPVAAGASFCRFVSSVSDLIPRHSQTKLSRKITKVFGCARNAAAL